MVRFKRIYGDRASIFRVSLTWISYLNKLPLVFEFSRKTPHRKLDFLEDLTPEALEFPRKPISGNPVYRASHKPIHLWRLPGSEY